MRQASSNGGVAKFLEGDRVTQLLVELASNGVVDFANADILDRKWKLKLKWLAESHSANKSAEVAKLAILRYTGSLGYGKAELFNESWEKVNELIQSYTKLAMPWIKSE